MAVDPHLRECAITALIAAAGTASLLAAASYVQSPYVYLVLVVGVAAFVWRFLANPRLRYLRLASIVAAAWSSAHALPNVSLFAELAGGSRLGLFLDGGPTWSFDLGSLAAFIALLVCDYRTHSGDSATRRLAAAIAISYAHQTAHNTGDSTQVVQSGTGNTTNIGLSGEAVTSLVEAAKQGTVIRTADAHGELERYADMLSQGHAEAALTLLRAMKRERWDTLTARERFRLQRMMGHAWKEKGDYEKAAGAYLEAIPLQPDDQEAAELEPLAYFMLDDREETLKASESVLSRFPYNAAAWEFKTRLAPLAVPVEDLEQRVPAPLKNNGSILMALAIRALGEGQYARAAEYMERWSPEPKDQFFKQQLLAKALIGRECQRYGTPSFDRESLSRAIDLAKAALARPMAKEMTSDLRCVRANAYELLGDTARAGFDYQAAIEMAPSDPEPALAYARLLGRIGHIDDAIAALRPVAAAPMAALMLSAHLANRNAPGDRVEATIILEKALPNCKADSDKGVSVNLVWNLAELCSATARHEEARALADSKLCEQFSEPIRFALRSIVHVRSGDVDKAADAAEKAFASLTEASDRESIDRSGIALQLAGLHQRAVQCWRRVLPDDCVTDVTHQAFASARKCGDDAFILSHCQALREHGCYDPLAIDLEASLLEKYSAFDRALEVAAVLEAKAPDSDAAKTMRVRKSVWAILSDRPDEVETSLERLPAVGSVSPQLGLTVVQVLAHRGPNLVAAEYAYELVRRHPANADARKAILAAVGIPESGFDTVCPPPTTAVPGVAVRFRDPHTGQETWTVIDDTGNPSAAMGEVAASSPRATRLLGHKVGDSVTLREDVVQERKIEIDVLLSKYVFCKRETFERWEEWFPDDPLIRRYVAPRDENGEPDVSSIVKVIAHHKEQVERLNEAYRSQPLSPTIFAAHPRLSVLEAIEHLASERLPLRCCFGRSENWEAAGHRLPAEPTPELLLDGSALAILLLTESYPHLTGVPVRLVVAAGSLLELKRVRRSLVHPIVGTGSTNGETRLREFIAWVETQCVIVDGLPLANVSADTRGTIIKVCGDAAAEGMAVAAARSAVLWADDFAVAQIAAEKFGVGQVWTQRVFAWLVERGHCSQRIYDEVSVELLRLGADFTRVNREMVVIACEMASWDPDDARIRNIGLQLESSGIDTQVAMGLFTTSLTMLWNRGTEDQARRVTRALAECIGRRSDGIKLLQSIIARLDASFVPDILSSAPRCRAAIEEAIGELVPRPRLILPGNGGTRL